MTTLAGAILLPVLHLLAGQLAEGAEREAAPVRSVQQDTSDAARVLQQRWKLRLVPDNCPEIDPALLGAAWSERTPHDILGRGTDHFIRFPVARDPHDG